MHCQVTGVAAFAGIEAFAQALRFVGRHHRKLFQPRLALAFQRLQQRLEPLLQIAAEAPRIDTGLGLRRQAEAFAKVVDAQRQRIVAALLRLHHLDAVPGRAGVPCR